MVAVVVVGGIRTDGARLLELHRPPVTEDGCVDQLSNKSIARSRPCGLIACANSRKLSCRMVSSRHTFFEDEITQQVVTTRARIEDIKERQRS